jgi:hypothetical protein
MQTIEADIAFFARFLAYHSVRKKRRKNETFYESDENASPTKGKALRDFGIFDLYQKNFDYYNKDNLYDHCGCSA